MARSTKNRSIRRKSKKMSKKKRQTKRRRTTKRRKYSKKKTYHGGASSYNITIDCFNVAENDNSPDIKSIARYECSYIAGYIEVSKDNHNDLRNNPNISSIMQKSYSNGGNRNAEVVLTPGTTANLLVWSNNFTKIEEIVPWYINDDTRNDNKSKRLGIRSTNFIKLKSVDSSIIFTCIVVHGNVKRIKRKQLLKSILSQSMTSDSIVNPIIIGDFNCEYDELRSIISEIEQDTTITIKNKFNIDALTANSATITHSNKHTREEKDPNTGEYVIFDINPVTKEKQQKTLFEARLDWILFPRELPRPYEYTIIENIIGGIHGKYDHKRVKNFVTIKNSNNVQKIINNVQNTLNNARASVIQCDPV